MPTDSTNTKDVHAENCGAVRSSAWVGALEAALTHAEKAMSGAMQALDFRVWGEIEDAVDSLRAAVESKRRKTNCESGQRAKRHCHQRLVRRVGMYLCHACGNYVERKAEDGQPLKKWRKSYCEKTGKNARIWLKSQHNIPH